MFLIFHHLLYKPICAYKLVYAHINARVLLCIHISVCNILCFTHLPLTFLILPLVDPLHHSNFLSVPSFLPCLFPDKFTYEEKHVTCFVSLAWHEVEGTGDHPAKEKTPLVSTVVTL